MGLEHSETAEAAHEEYANWLRSTLNNNPLQDHIISRLEQFSILENAMLRSVPRPQFVFYRVVRTTSRERRRVSRVQQAAG